MNKILERHLVEKYPKLFVDYRGDPIKTTMAWGCECGDGWINILDEACEKLSKIDGICFVQIKEKFGDLTIYLNQYNDDVDKILDKAVERSRVTCEVCGKDGKRRGGRWIQVLCDLCDSKKK